MFIFAAWALLVGAAVEPRQAVKSCNNTFWQQFDRIEGERLSLRTLAEFDQLFGFLNDQLERLTTKISTAEESEAGELIKESTEVSKILHRLSEHFQSLNLNINDMKQATPLTVASFFPDQDDGSNMSEKLSPLVQEQLQAAVAYLNRMQFTQEKLQAILTENLRSMNHHRLNPSLSDEGCQDLSLFWALLHKRFGNDWMLNPDLPHCYKLSLALCIIIGKHFLMEWGPDSFLGCHVPQRQKKVNFLQELDAKGVIIKQECVANAYARLAVLTSWIVKSRIYSELGSLAFKTPRTIGEVQIPVVAHFDSLTNLFCRIEEEQIPVFSLLTNFSRTTPSSDFPEKPGKILIRATYNSFADARRSGMPDAGIFIEFFSCNLSSEQQTSTMAALQNFDAIKVLGLKSAEVVDLGRDGELLVGNVACIVPDGRFSSDLLSRLLVSGRLFARVRHIFWGRTQEVLAELDQKEPLGYLWDASRSVK